jgi:hypothetical protein
MDYSEVCAVTGCIEAVFRQCRILDRRSAGLKTARLATFRRVVEQVRFDVLERAAFFVPTLYKNLVHQQAGHKDRDRKGQNIRQLE